MSDVRPNAFTPLLGDVSPAGARVPLAAFLAGEMSPETTLMELVCWTEDPSQVRQLLQDAERALRAPDALAPADADAACMRLGELRATLDRNAGGAARIARMLREGPDTSAPARTVEEGLEFVERLFDWSVAQNEEASVALYSLGDAGILERATQEIVRAFDRWGLLAEGSTILQIGCGIGRFEVALAPRVRAAYGIDVSGEMIARAQVRCADLRNVHLQKTDGRDLSMFADAMFDLVYAVDSFPYLVQAGDALVDTHFAQAHRVLKPGGVLAILNFSYRGDPAADARDVAGLAGRHAFEVIVSAEKPFELWNGSAFVLRRELQLR